MHKSMPNNPAVGQIYEVVDAPGCRWQILAVRPRSIEDGDGLEGSSSEKQAPDDQIEEEHSVPSSSSVADNAEAEESEDEYAD